MFCGCATLGWGKAPPTSRRRPWTAPRDVRGRAAAIRVNSRYGDVTRVGLHLPPRSKDPKEQLRLRIAIEQTSSFAMHVVASLRSRTVPVAAADVNGGIGRCRGQRAVADVDSSVVGPRGTGEEYFAGAPSKAAFGSEFGQRVSFEGVFRGSASHCCGGFLGGSEVGDLGESYLRWWLALDTIPIASEGFGVQNLVSPVCVLFRRRGRLSWDTSDSDVAKETVEASLHLRLPPKMEDMRSNFMELAIHSLAMPPEQLKGDLTELFPRQRLLVEKCTFLASAETVKVRDDPEATIQALAAKLRTWAPLDSRSDMGEPGLVSQLPHGPKRAQKNKGDRFVVRDLVRPHSVSTESVNGTAGCRDFVESRWSSWARAELYFYIFEAPPFLQPLNCTAPRAQQVRDQLLEVTGAADGGRRARRCRGAATGAGRQFLVCSATLRPGRSRKLGRLGAARGDCGPDVAVGSPTAILLGNCAATPCIYEGLGLHLSISFQYRLLPDELHKLYRLTNTQYEMLFTRIARDQMLEAASQYEGPQYWLQRHEIGNRMKGLVSQQLRDSYADLWGLQLLVIDLPDRYEQSITMTQVQQQLIKTRTNQQAAASIRADTEVMKADFDSKVQALPGRRRTTRWRRAWPRRQNPTDGAPLAGRWRTLSRSSRRWVLRITHHGLLEQEGAQDKAAAGERPGRALVARAARCLPGVSPPSRQTRWPAVATSWWTTPCATRWSRCGRRPCPGCCQMCPWPRERVEKFALRVAAEGLGDKDRKVRAAAAEALGALGREVAGPHLDGVVGLCADRSSQVRRAAARAAGRIGEPAVELIEQLVAVLRDYESEVRAAAAEGLGALGVGRFLVKGESEIDDREIDIGLKLAAAVQNDTSFSVRSAACTALASIDEGSRFSEVLLIPEERRRAGRPAGPGARGGRRRAGRARRRARAARGRPHAGAARQRGRGREAARGCGGVGAAGRGRRARGGQPGCVAARRPRRGGPGVCGAGSAGDGQGRRR
ncbi:unnamed protein product [Prorocentrum cordatum]|uniref:Band 7 domain-containing protein n=1 Tax=Prorocentrum cordatum TaxID=2364126 RepID=A0ABN9Y895_9DINO|nr:unnamed protein product [Polarella glacialis]